jgi:hypothetical protein
MPSPEYEARSGEAVALPAIPAGRTTVAIVLAWCVGLAVLLAPLLATSRPRLQDYPNHLSRVEIMRLAADPALSAHYEVLPLRPGNAAFDAFVLAASHVMSPETGGRLFVILALVLTATGCVALRGAFGLPPDITLVAALPFLYSASFAVGLLPHLIGIAVALHAMALWILATRWPWFLRFCAGAISGVLLVTLHLYAFGVFALFVAGEALARIGSRHSWRGMAFWLRLMREGLIAVPVLAVLATTPGTADLAGSAVIHWSPDKPLRLLSLFGFGPWWVALLTGCLWLAAVAPVARLAGLSVDPRARLAVLLMIAAFVALPRSAGELYEIDWRVLTPAVLVALAGTRLDMAPPVLLLRRTVLALLALMVAMATSLSFMWRPSEAAEADLLAITAPLAPGSRLFWGISDPDTLARIEASELGTYHIASDAVAARRIMVSTTFAVPGQHPIRLRDPYLRALRHLSAVNLIFAASLFARDGIALADVIRHFDHVLLYGPPGPEEAQILPAERLQFVRGLGDFRLYRVLGNGAGG